MEEGETGMGVDEEDIETRLGKILAQRRERLGIVQEEPFEADPEPPLYLQAARERAARLGCDLDDLLRRDLEQMRESRYPGPDCLDPGEVEAYVENGTLPTGRLAHVETCPECRALLSAVVVPPLQVSEEPARTGNEKWRSAHPAPGPRVPLPWRSVLATAAGILAMVGLLWWGTSFPFADSPGLRRVAVLSPASASDGSSGLAVACSQMVTSILEGDQEVDVVLSGTESARFSLWDVGRLKHGLRSDLFVRCSEDGSGPTAGRLVVEIEQDGKQKVEKSFESQGGASEVFDLVFKAGQWVRAELAGEVGEVAPPDNKEQYRYVLPKETQAARLYAQGLEQLWRFRPQRATVLLGEAANREKHPLVFSALAEAWAQLGDSKRSQQAAEAAFQAANDYSLPEREELILQGQRSESVADWQEAVRTYESLEEISPNPVGAGVYLAKAYLATSDAKSALAKVEELRRPEISALDAARLDLVEAEAAEILSDPVLQREAALRAAQAGRDLAARSLEADASIMAGRAVRVQRNLEEAGELFSRAEQLFEEIGDENGIAAALREQGVSARFAHDIPRAEDLLSRSLFLYRKLNNHGGVAKLEIDLGHLDADSNRYQEAMAHYEIALRIFERLGNEQGRVRALTSKGILFWDSKDFAAAHRHFEKALEINEKISDRSGAATVLTNLGQLLFEEGRLRESREALEKALAIREETGLRRAESISHTALAEVLVYEDDLSGAEQHYKAALDIGRELGNPPQAMARVRLRRAVAWMEQGKLAQAEAEVRTLRAHFQEQKMPSAEAGASAVLAHLLLLQQRTSEAREILSRVEISGNSRLSDEVALLSARLEIASGRPAEAVAVLQPLIEQSRKQGLALLGLEARLLQAEAYQAMGQADVAQKQLQAIEKEAGTMGADLLVRKAKALLHSNRTKLTLSSLLSFFLFGPEEKLP